MSESNRDKAAQGGWGLGAVAEVDLSANRRTLLSDGVLRVFADDGVNVLREERLVTAGNVGAADRVIRLNGGGPSEGITSMVEPATNPQPAPGQVCRATPANFGALPNPAPGQVWVPPAGEWADRFVDADGTVTVATADGTTVRFVGGGGCADVDMDGPANGWRCIGVATPHGRVMVGDGFRFDDGPEATVTAVCDHDSHVRMSDGMAHRAAWVLAFGKRTRYAPARVGERYLHRSRKYMVAIPSTPSILCLGNAMWGEEVRVHLSAGVSMPVDEWERLDPSTTSHAVPTVPSPDRATGAALDALASSLGIKRAQATGSAYRGMTDLESDESLRARCMAKLGVPHARAVDMGDGVSAVRGGIAEAIALANGIRDALAFTRIHGTRLANPGGIPTASPEPTSEERIATAIADRRAPDLGVPRREGEPAGDFRRRLNRHEVRRAVDRHVALARREPFGHAIASALHAWAETVHAHDTVADVADLYARLLRYEALRGSRREPSLAALDVGVPETARVVYERERGGKRVEAVTPQQEPARPTGGASLNGWQTAAHFWERWSR